MTTIIKFIQIVTITFYSLGFYDNELSKVRSRIVLFLRESRCIVTTSVHPDKIISYADKGSIHGRFLIFISLVREPDDQNTRFFGNISGTAK